MKYLLTGGAGFIGSHLAEALLERQEQVTIIDDLSNSIYLYSLVSRIVEVPVPRSHACPCSELWHRIYIDTRDWINGPAPSF